MDFFQNGVSIDATISDGDLLAAMDSQTGNRGYVSKGALLASISEAVGDMKGVVISTAAPNDADGRPVNTIYFQVPA